MLSTERCVLSPLIILVAINPLIELWDNLSTCGFCHKLLDLAFPQSVPQSILRGMKPSDESPLLDFDIENIKLMVRRSLSMLPQKFSTYWGAYKERPEYQLV